MVTNKKLSGFSLLEACVTMLIVAVFVALCSSAFTKRHITYQESDGHGRYECYKVGDKNVQRYVENNSPRNVVGDTCVFRPPRYAKYLLINASGGGSASGAGTFISMFYTSLDAPLTITLGAVGGTTTISKNGTTIVSASGGGGEMVATSSAATTVKECKFQSTLFTGCGTTANCTQSGSDLSVTFCRSNDPGDSQNLQIPIADVKTYKQSWSGSKLVYSDISDYIGHNIDAKDAVTMVRSGTFNSYFTVEVEFNTTNSTQSQMENYISALGLPTAEGIGSTKPGAVGQPGAVLILW